MNGRRARWRFPLSLKLSYSVRDCRTVTGSGMTLDIASGGVRFQAEAGLAVDDDVQLIIHWPVLCGAARLNLMVWGQIIRHDARGFVLVVRGSEFRTRGRSASLGVSAVYTSAPVPVEAHKIIRFGDETMRVPSSL